MFSTISATKSKLLQSSYAYLFIQSAETRVNSSISHISNHIFHKAKAEFPLLCLLFLQSFLTVGINLFHLDTKTIHGDWSSQKHKSFVISPYLATHSSCHHKLILSYIKRSMPFILVICWIVAHIQRGYRTTEASTRKNFTWRSMNLRYRRGLSEASLQKSWWNRPELLGYL